MPCATIYCGEVKSEKFILILCLLVFVVSPIKAQTSVLSVGVRGGGQMWLPSAATGVTAKVQSGLGYTGALDLRYTYYGEVANNVSLGVGIGFGAGYGTTALKGTNTDVFSNTDYLGNQLDYTVTAAFRQTDQWVKGEASLLFAMRFGGVTVNIGPRFMMPFAASRLLTITQSTIDAYFPQYNVHVVNELTTGVLQTPFVRKENVSLPQYNLLLAAEIGYEWAFDAHIVGVQAYMDCGVWNINSSAALQLTRLIFVSPITDATNPPPTVTVASPEMYVTGRRYLDFGIRVYYAFSLTSQTRRRHPSAARDTRHHHNRYLWR